MFNLTAAEVSQAPMMAVLPNRRPQKRSTLSCATGERKEEGHCSRQSGADLATATRAPDL